MRRREEHRHAATVDGSQRCGKWQPKLEERLQIVWILDAASNYVSQTARKSRRII